VGIVFENDGSGVVIGNGHSSRTFRQHHEPSSQRGPQRLRRVAGTRQCGRQGRR
jgi:hypothetical protein